jgi:hypothetical protein
MSDISEAKLTELETVVTDLNELVAELVAKHGGDFNIQMFVAYREDEPPGVTVTIRKVFAEFGSRAGFSR